MSRPLERELGVTYKTAWRMAHLIRNELMAQDDGTLNGEVEVDETLCRGEASRRVAWATWQGLAQDPGVRHRAARHRLSPTYPQMG